MRRLIDADKLKKYVDDQEGRPFIGVTIGEAFKIMVDEQPTIERKTGKWIPHEDEDGEHYGDKCSECGEWYVMPYGKTNFCPNCGARMEDEE